MESQKGLTDDRAENNPREVDFQQEVKNKFQSAFEEAYRRTGQGDIKPEVEVGYHFSRHGRSEDFFGLRGKLSQDTLSMYVPEFSGWRQKDLELFRRASFGETTKKELNR